MSSSAQIVTRAMFRLRKLDATETPSAADAAYGLAALNAMIAGWQADSINISNDVPLPSEHEEGIVALLAMRLSDDFAVTPTPQLVKDAKKGWSRLQGAYITPGIVHYDTALRTTPAKPLVYFITLNKWVASTAYSEFDRISSADGRKAYECIVAGTTASTGTGPTSEGGEITDGTVTWRFLGFTN